jgi:MFS family permease
MAGHIELQGVGSKAQKMDKYGWIVLSLTMTGWIFDGFDQMVFAMVAPWIISDWKLTTVEIGLIGSFFLVGHATGSVVAATLADYVGRKPMLWIATVVYSLFTGLAAFTKGVYSLGIARALAGLGTGGFWPVSLSMLSEHVPSHMRGRMIGLMNSGYPVGFLLSIAVTGTIGIYYRENAGEWGWMICFIVGAIPGLIVALIMSRVLKESELWIKSRAIQKEKKQQSFSLLELLKPAYFKNTLTAIIIQIGAMMCY